MKNINDIKELGENEVLEMLNKGEISRNTFDEYYTTTSIYQRNLVNNSVWESLKI